MPRYEFVDGSSSKFWEIEQKGSELHIAWGRIGTGGQSQIKSYASEGKAKADYDKLIKEKTGKGYGAVGAAAAAPAVPGPVAAGPVAAVPVAAGPVVGVAPPPAAPLPPPAPAVGLAPAPAPPVTPENTAVHLVISPELLQALRPTRQHPPKNRRNKAVNLPELWTLARQSYARVEHSWKAGEARIHPAAAARSAAVRERWAGKEPPHFDPSFEGLCLFLTFMALHQGSHRLRDEAFGLVDHWCQTAGIEAAVEAVIVALQERLQVDHPERVDHYPYFLLEPGQEAGEEGHRYLFLDTHYLVERLRPHLVQTPPELYQRLLARMRSAVVEDPLYRLYLPVAFPDETDLAEQAFGLWRTEYVWNVGPLLATAMSASQKLEIYQKNPASPALHGYLIELLPTAGVAAFEAILAAFRAHSAAGETGKERLRALAFFGGSEVVEFFVSIMDDKHYRPIATQYLQEHPQLAIGPLKARVRRGDKQAALYAGLLEAVERRIGVGREPVELPVASAQQLPPVLQNPPWRGKKQAATLPTLAGLILPTNRDSIEWKTSDNLDYLRRRYHYSGADAIYDSCMANGAGLPLNVLLAQDDARLKAGWERVERGGEELSWWGIHLLARLGPAAIPRMGRLLIHAPSAFSELMRIRSPHLALAAVVALERKSTRAVGMEWLLENAELAALGLFPIAFAELSTSAGMHHRVLAQRCLRLLTSKGRAEEVSRAAAYYGPDAERALEVLLAFDPLSDYPSKLPKLPDWLDMGNLPPVRLKSGERLPPAAVQATVEMLSFSNLDLPYAGLEQLRSACSAESLETLAQDLATRWVTAGAAPAQRWAAQSLALIGGDDAARWLAGQIDRWVAEKSKARWMDALELLAQIGTDRALMWLGRLARRGRIATLKEAAGEKLSMVAAERGLSLEELEDRTVPDLGLDEQGSLRLDFGPRQFYVSFDEQLSPVVLDAERQPLAALPRIQKQDDPEKAKAAWEQYKQLKDDASKSCAHQIRRMERAMALERRWSVEEFRAFLLQHPLMRHLVRRLVWAVQGPGQPLTSFRVSEDLSIADCEENILELPAEAEVWVLHPLRMEPLLPVWGQIFADYGILQPFPQLSRPIFRPLAALTGDRPLEQYAGRLAGRSWLYGLRSWGWNFDGDPYNGYSSMSRSGPGPLQLRFRLDPGIYEHSDTGKEQKLGAVTLSGGSWADLGEVGYSELIRQLEAVLLR